MGSKDKFQKEHKKPKKDAKRAAPTIFESVTEVEVIRKKGKKEEFPE